MTPEEQAIHDFLNGLTRLPERKRITRQQKLAWAEQARYVLDYYFPAPEPAPDTVTINGKVWRITQGYSEVHPAYDLVPVDGDDVITPVVAGEVIWAGRDERAELAQHPEWDRGNYVIIQVTSYEHWYYCHAEELLAVPEELVGPEMGLGKMGNTGYTDGGSHWHIRCQRAGVDVDWVREQ